MSATRQTKTEMKECDSDWKMVTQFRRAYIGSIVVIGALILIRSAWFPANPMFALSDRGRYLSWCLITLAASGLKVQLPAVNATMSLNFLFVLIGIGQFNLGEALLLGCLGVFVQCVFHARNRPEPIQVAFSMASVACSIKIAFVVHHAPGLESYLLTATAYFLSNTIFVAAVIALTDLKNPWHVWRDAYLWSFPNYLVGAGGAWLVDTVGRFAGWQSSLLLLPILYLVYRSHTLYIGRLDEARRRAEQQIAHAGEVASLHRSTIETLALAVEAKDQTTRDHLDRVETYAIAIGRELGLDEAALETLASAALLHDIGKLAVPEYIISKPGRLTPEEFETMKTHTVVGAQIVQRMGLASGVAAMVRGHHEKWNGTGYPDGLAGEQIPLGARILGAVDCLDAITSDRQYRVAVPFAKALEIVRGESGRSFDPRIVEVLIRQHLTSERVVRSSGRIADLPVGVRIDRGDAPATGFETLGPPEGSEDRTGANLEVLDRATRENSRTSQILRNLSEDITACSNQDQVFALLRRWLGSLIPYDALIVYLKDGGMLKAVWTDGDLEPQSASRVQPGQGLSGWVAENGRPIANGNPAVEPWFMASPSRKGALVSALAVPIDCGQGGIGVLSLYSRQSNSFTASHLESLTVLSASIAGIVGPFKQSGTE